MLTTPILSPLGKMRLAWERFIPRRQASDDESLACFCRRRLGRETYERLVQPLIGGIYTGDPEKLSLRATMPRFAEMEEKDGSLIRALRSAPQPSQPASGARYSMFTAPRDGMASLVDAIANCLPPPSIRLNTGVVELARRANGWRVVTPHGDEPREYDGVILATPAPVTARLLATVDREISRRLAEIHHASCSIVALGFRREQVGHPLNGFGVVVPDIEKRRILSASFSSIKYAGRAPDGSVLIRVFIGGDKQPELADLPDDRLLELAVDELRELLGIQGDPQFTSIRRWRATMPQYFVGHQERIAEIRDLQRRHPGLAIAGNAFDGVGVPLCIRSGEQAAENLVAALRASGAR